MKEKYSDGIEWNTYEKLRKERPELFAESTQIPIVTDKETVDTFVSCLLYTSPSPRDRG